MYRVYSDRVFTDGYVSINTGGRMSLIEFNHAFVNNRIAGDKCDVPIAVIIRVSREFFEGGFPLRKFLHTNDVVTAIIYVIFDLYSCILFAYPQHLDIVSHDGKVVGGIRYGLRVQSIVSGN